MESWILDLVKNAGPATLAIVLLYRLLDKFTIRLAEALEQQADAMQKMANSVSNGMGIQEEVLLAIRAQSVEIHEIKSMCRGGRACEQ